MAIFENIRKSFVRILHVNDTPHKIAAGVAIGAFIGVFPTFGIGSLLALFLSGLFKYNYIF